MNLKANSYKLRQDILDIVYHAKGGHIGGDMSVSIRSTSCITSR